MFVKPEKHICRNIQRKHLLNSFANAMPHLYVSDLLKLSVA